MLCVNQIPEKLPFLYVPYANERKNLPDMIFDSFRHIPLPVSAQIESHKYNDIARYFYERIRGLVVCHTILSFQ